MTSLRSLPAWLAASAVLSLAPLASAIVAPGPQPTYTGCASNQECGRGYECTVVATSGCAPSAACAPGETCPTPEPCTVTEEHACMPAHCASDADCADGMVCHEWTDPGTATNCACAPNTDCACPDPAPPTTVKMCTPPYVLPCTTASDCGDGFDCKEAQSCGCSGSAGTAGGAAPAPMAPLPPEGSAGASSADIAPPDCTCEPSGTFECVVKPVACQADTDCVAGWQCVQEVAVSQPACAPGADCPPPEPLPMPTSGTCQPPYYGAQGGSDLGVPTSSESGSGTPKDGTGTGSNGGTVSPEVANAGDGESHESSACQFGRAPISHGAFGLLAALGALAGLSRRRRAAQR